MLLVRAALKRVVADGGERGQGLRRALRRRDLRQARRRPRRCSKRSLGDLWPWLTGKLEGFRKPPYKGKTPSQYVDDDEAATFLYDEGLEFQTNYNVTEDKVRNSVRRVDAILESLNKRRTEDAKKKT